jgi:hypothetical protein
MGAQSCKPQCGKQCCAEEAKQNEVKLQTVVPLHPVDDLKVPNYNSIHYFEEPEKPQKELSYFERELASLEMVSSSGPDGRRPPFSFPSGAVYIGEWRGNQRHGFGVQTWPDGASYKGQFKDNIADGAGCFQHANSEIYIGQWLANKAHGHGIYYGIGRRYPWHKDETKYEGQWQNDHQEGYGVETWGDGSRYSGLFRNGEKALFGMYLFPDHSQYLGGWSSNSINGHGAYIGNDGRDYKGTWQNSVIHGIGKYTWPDTREYIGQYALDKKHGFGIFSWPGGRKYVGFWRDGKEGDGQVIEAEANGSTAPQAQTLQRGASSSSNDNERAMVTDSRFVQTGS